MKFLAVALTYFITYTKFVACVPDTDAIENLYLSDDIEACAAEVGLLVEETKTSLNMPIEVPGNCVVACMWKKIGLMTPNEKISKEEMVKNIRPTFQDISNTMTIVENDFYQCVDEANVFEGACIVVSEYFKCLIKFLMSTNLDN